MMETILVGIAKDITVSLSRLAIDEITKVLSLKNEINKLQRKLESMMSIIQDAEKTTVQHETTKDWLKQLKEVMYEAEDIIDRCRIEAEKLKTSQPQECNVSSVFNCCRSVVVDRKIAGDIAALNKKMEEIKLGSEQLHLKPVAEDQTRLDRDIAPDLEPDIAGRDVENDSNYLLMLLAEDHDRNCLLFAVVGTVGVGKTTLARKIYHDARTRTIFETTLWVYVSKDLRYVTIWSDGTFTRAEAGEQLAQVSRCLVGRKFLLIIDDVWTERVWDRLLEAHAQHGAPGSRVLITSRQEHVARRMGMTYLHRVKKLNEDDGWWLLHTRALLKESTGNMQDIGRRIVQKCNGLPMAIRRIGCHLRDVEPSEDEWERVYLSNFCGISEEIQQNINMSYLDLPYHLKRCFLYCSLLPEGFVIEQQFITKQWIAEGFVETNNNSTLEAEAEKCYKELVGRSLLLPEHQALGVMGSKMPHLIRTFALLLSQDENFNGNPQDMSDVFKPRRLSITNGGAEAISEHIEKLTSLRALLLFGSLLNDNTLDDIFRKLTHLRILDLGATQIEHITGNLGRLVHLRYLNLSDTRVREIPVDIQHLRMLQFLILKNCLCLNSLPEFIGQLTHLRGLDISGTRLNHVRFGFSKMKELNCIQGFLLSPPCPGNYSGWPFEELSTLSKLTSLQIMRLERALDREDASKCKMQEKLQLKELGLICSADERPMERPRDAERIQEIFEVLKPGTRLISLKLENYNGQEYPSWVSASDLPQLQRLNLNGCLHCQHLPYLGQMKNLKFLAITGFNRLSAIGPELCGMPDNGIAFPKLEQLLLSNMCCLESWSGLGRKDMPLLQYFQLDSCPKLNSLPSWLEHCTSLTFLQIRNADSLAVIENLPALKELEVHETQKLERISNLPWLEDLKVKHCSLLDVVRDVPSLRLIHLDDRNEIKLPEWLQQQALALRRLEIIGKEELLDKCSSAAGPYWSVIQRADHVHARSPDGSSYFSYTKTTGCFWRSQRAMDRASFFSSPSFDVPVVPPSVVLEDEVDNADKRLSRTMSMAWMRNQLFLILLYVVQYFIFWFSGSGSPK